MYSGLMPINLENNTEGSLFFWLVEKRNDSDNAYNSNISKDTANKKLIIWVIELKLF
jgi:hypothetical protein